jgi:hypothetical protein
MTATNRNRKRRAIQRLPRGLRGKCEDVAGDEPEEAIRLVRGMFPKNVFGRKMLNS